MHFAEKCVKIYINMLENIEKNIQMVNFTYFTRYPSDIDAEDAERTHTHSFYELFIKLEGNCGYTVEDKRHELQSAELIIVPPGHRHRMEKNACNEQNPIVRGLLMQFDIPEEQREHPVFALLSAPRVIALNTIPEIVTLIHAVSHHGAIFSEDEFRLLEKTYVMQLLMLLYKLTFVTVNVDSRMNHITLHILAYIHQHLTEKLNVRSIAATLKFNESYIANIFKKDMHITIMQYIKRRRLELTQALLFGGERPMQAMYKSGFTDYPNFFKEFRKMYGMTPKEMWLNYRKEAPQGKL